MGNYFTIATHSAVPSDVKEAVPAIDFVPADEDQLEKGLSFCPECEENFGWFCKPVNCVWCGCMRCRRCCPNRHLLGDAPACAACTGNAYRIRRSQMLQDHYASSGVSQSVPAVALPPSCRVVEDDNDAKE